MTTYEFDLNQLCVDHAGIAGDGPGGANAPRFDDFLRALNGVAHERPQLALLVFDCKPPAATPTLGPVILSDIRRMLTYDTGLNVFISIGNVTSSNPYRLDGTSVFERSRGGDRRPADQLRDRGVRHEGRRPRPRLRCRHRQGARAARSETRVDSGAGRLAMKRCDDRESTAKA